jgi:hypothetical protein
MCYSIDYLFSSNSNTRFGLFKVYVSICMGGDCPRTLT